MTPQHIGVWREQHLHAALKEWYRRDGDRLEVGVDGFVIDLVRDDLLVEIQTRGFSSLRDKLDRLLDAHRIRLVHPIAAEKWIRRIDDTGAEVSRRRSPKRGVAADVCAELVSFPSLLRHPGFTLEVLLVEEEEVRRPDPTSWRRKGWRIAERRLVGILKRAEFTDPIDLLSLLPGNLPDPFTSADLAAGLGRTRRRARQVAYCLREAGVLEVGGRTRGGIQYFRPVAVDRRAEPEPLEQGSPAGVVGEGVGVLHGAGTSEPAQDGPLEGAHHTQEAPVHSAKGST